MERNGTAYRNGTFVTYPINETTKYVIRSVTYDQLPEMSTDWVWVWLVNCLAGLVGYFFMRSSAKILTQVSSKFERAFDECNELFFFSKLFVVQYDR